MQSQDARGPPLQWSSQRMLHSLPKQPSTPSQESAGHSSSYLPSSCSVFASFSTFVYFAESIPNGLSTRHPSPYQACAIYVLIFFGSRLMLAHDSRFPRCPDCATLLPSHVSAAHACHATQLLASHVWAARMVCVMITGRTLGRFLFPKTPRHAMTPTAALSAKCSASSSTMIGFEIHIWFLVRSYYRGPTYPNDIHSIVFSFGHSLAFTMRCTGHERTAA